VKKSGVYTSGDCVMKYVFTGIATLLQLVVRSYLIMLI